MYYEGRLCFQRERNCIPFSGHLFHSFLGNAHGFVCTEENGGLGMLRVWVCVKAECAAAEGTSRLISEGILANITPFGAGLSSEFSRSTWDG